MDDAPLLVTVGDGIATITLNRPERMNTVTVEMLDLWREAIVRARRDDDVRVIVVTGAGDRAFCAGADLSGGQLGAGGAEPAVTHFRAVLRESVHQIQRELRILDKPYLAAVNGAATGAGMDLASMADLRFAADTARFGMSFVKVGAIPGDGGAYYLPRLVGLPTALHLIWSGELFSADQAHRWGYVHEVVPADALLERVREYAKPLVEGPAVAIQLAKRLVYQCLHSTEEQALELASNMMSMAMNTEDGREGPRAFAERRPPVFTGR